jgi:hypothetical protein
LKSRLGDDHCSMIELIMSWIIPLISALMGSNFMF